MNDAAEALRSLATLLRSGLDLRSALCAWPEDVPPRLTARVSAIARRARLGDDPGRCISLLGADGSVASAFVETHGRFGGDLAIALDAHAARLDRDHAAAAGAAAAGAGAKTSARLVAGLPLLFVPLLPRSTGGLEAGTLSLAAAGALLSGLGIWLIDRLLPRPERLVDPVAEAADLIAALLRAGAGVQQAMEAAARHFPSLRTAAAAARLGAPWPDAVARLTDLSPLAAPLRRAAIFGVPAAAALKAEADRRRRAAAAAFESAARRAPVMMAVPLALCVLPAYLLLGVVPLLRGG